MPGADRGARATRLRAWAHLDAEAALAQARARDGEPSRGPLHGIPVGVKDVIDTADMPTSYGSPIYEGHRPARDADCVAWLREQGAVILGKTVTTEFATYEPPPTRNPHDPDRTPGGSSSGSAAAVADGMVPLAYGTQTAGSVIRPASFCGVVGFKPSPRLALDRRHQAPQRAARHARDVRPHRRRRRAAGRVRGALGRAADRLVPHAVGRAGRRRGRRRAARPPRARAAARLRRPRRRAGDGDGVRRRAATSSPSGATTATSSHRRCATTSSARTR